MTKEQSVKGAGYEKGGAAGGVWPFMVCVGLLILSGCGDADVAHDVQRENFEGAATKTERQGAIPPALELELQAYYRTVEIRLGQIKEQQARLLDHIQDMRVEGELQGSWKSTLDDLAVKSRAVQRRIEALKTANDKNWPLLQGDMDQALDEMTQAYETALARFQE